MFTHEALVWVVSRSLGASKDSGKYGYGSCEKIAGFILVKIDET